MTRGSATVSRLAPLGARLWRRRARASPGRRTVELWIGVGLLAPLAAGALLAPLLAPADPNTVDVDALLAPPFTEGHLLGTDQLGRDELSRLLYGLRADLAIGCAAIVAPFLFGTLVGALAGYYGGWLDSLVSRVIDVVLAFPVIVLVIALVFAIGPGVLGILVAIAVVEWVAYARIVRATVARERTLDYALAARAGGLPDRRVLFGHVMPNVIGQNVVYAMSHVVIVILAVVTLGFLGIGIPPPSPDLGVMVSDAQPFVTSHWWLAVFPGAAIVLIGLAFSLIADGLAAILDAE